jgi:hypothetical protein
LKLIKALYWKLQINPDSDPFVKSSVDEVDSDHTLVDGVDGVDDDDNGEDQEEEGDSSADRTFHLKEKLGK